MTSILELAQHWAENSRILLVEDDTDVAKMVRELLERYDCELEVAGRVSDAINAVVSRKFDLIFIDLLLPDGSGVDVIKTVKAHAPVTPILVMTGVAQPRLIDEALACGVVTVLHKPFDITSQQLRYILDMFKVRARMRPQQQRGFNAASAPAAA